MAYVSAWGRDGIGSGSGGSWRGMNTRALCEIPGCARPVGAAGDACADCRTAYGALLGSGKRRSSGARCWLCGGHAADTDAACVDCAPVAVRENVTFEGVRVGAYGTVLRTG